MNVKDHIGGTSTFQYYRDSSLWYKTDDTGLLFSVPISDIGPATFERQEKSMILMRYIRKWISALKDDF